MLERKSVVNQLEFAVKDNLVQIRFALMVVDGPTTVSSKWHRTAVPIGAHPDAAAVQMAAVNADLVEHGEEPVGAEDVARVVNFYNLCSTLG